MKKAAIALAILTATLSTVSCLKENGSETVKYTPMTFCAESKEMNTESSKAEMAYRYDLLWQKNDEILLLKPHISLWRFFHAANVERPQDGPQCPPCHGCRVTLPAIKTYYL